MSRHIYGVALAVVSLFSVHHEATGQSPPVLSFVRHDLSAQGYAEYTQGNDIGDIDGDGRPDIVVGGNGYLYWLHNPDWTPNLIQSGYDFAAGAMVVVRDMDGDGRLDVVTGKYSFGATSTRQTVWFGNTPSGWVEHVLSSTAFCHDLVFGDLNGDGRADAACNDQFVGEILWLESPADPAMPWVSHPIDARSAMGNALADIDRDGRLDIVAGRAWYRNDGGGSSWTRIPYTTLTDANHNGQFNDYEKVSVLDLNGDGRLDVFATIFAESPEGQVWAFLAPADPVGSPWTAVQIDPGPLFCVHSQAAASFDGSSRIQVMVGESNYGGWDFGPNPDPQIYVYRLLGAATNPAAWEHSIVDRYGTHEARAADLDGDGLPDIVGHTENTNLLSPPQPGVVSWWQNTTVTVEPTTTTTTLHGCG